MMARSLTDIQHKLSPTAFCTALFGVWLFIFMSAQTMMSLSYPAETPNDVRMTLYYVQYASMFLGYLAAVLLIETHIFFSKKVYCAVVSVLFAASMIGLCLTDGLPLYVVCMIVCTFMAGMSCVSVQAVLAILSGRDPRIRMGRVIGGGGAVAVAVHWVLLVRFPAGVAVSILLAALYVAVFFVLYVRMGGQAGAAGDCLGYAPVGEPDKDLCKPTFSAEGPDGKLREQLLPAGKDAIGRKLISLCIAGCGLMALFPFYEVYLNSLSFATYFYGWARLLLIGGYLIVGAAVETGRKNAAPLAVLCLSLMTVIYALLVREAAISEIPTALFYLSLGAVIAWLHLAFIRVAPETRHPALWASMGRFFDTVVGGLGGVLLLLAPGVLSPMPAAIINLILLGIVIAAMTNGGFLNADTGDDAQDVQEADQDTQDVAQATPKANMSPEERLERFMAAYSFTPREADVLRYLITTDKKNQEIADEIYISRRQLQNHISSIYEKTGAKSRAGLLLLVNDEAL